MDNEKNIFEEIELLKNRITELEARPRGIKIFFQKAFNKTHVLIGILGAALFTGVLLYAAQISFTDGSLISASEVNNNFTDLYRLTGANVETISSNKTLSAADKRTQIININGSSRDITLPSTGIVKGERFIIHNINSSSTQQELTVKSSAGETIDIVASRGDGSVNTSRGYIVVAAKTDTPTTKANWLVEDVYEEYDGSGAGVVLNGGAGATITSGAVNIVIYLTRKNKILNLTFSFSGTYTASGNIFTIGKMLPARFKPKAGNPSIGFSVDYDTNRGYNLAYDSTNNAVYCYKGDQAFVIQVWASSEGCPTITGVVVLE